MAATARNPDWSRDELILALELYLRHRKRLPDTHSKEVADLSALLNAIGAEISGKRESFRNANGVYMKLANFRAIDPSYTSQGRKGLQRGGKGDSDVWVEFADNPGRLSAVADAIRTAVADGEVAALPEVNADEMMDAPEGRLLTRVHLSRERNRKLVAKRKELAIRTTGKLLCDACGFDFSAIYGERGTGFIEAHHLNAVHTLQAGSRTRVQDLALVCANCHRMIHAKQPWLTLDELRAIISRDR